MHEAQQIVDIDLSDLMNEVAARRTEGCRLAAVTATRTGSRYEICYTFDRNYRILTCRVNLFPRDTLPSITGVYPSAFVYENELQDIFGIAVTGSRVAVRDNRPRKRVTYPPELSQPFGATPCQNR